MLVLSSYFHRVCWTLGSFIAAAALFIFLRVIIGWCSSGQKLEKLGHKAPLVAYKLPFGTRLVEIFLW